MVIGGCSATFYQESGYFKAPHHHVLDATGNETFTKHMMLTLAKDFPQSVIVWDDDEWHTISYDMNYQMPELHW